MSRTAKLTWSALALVWVVASSLVAYGAQWMIWPWGLVSWAALSFGPLLLIGLAAWIVRSRKARNEPPRRAEG